MSAIETKGGGGGLPRPYTQGSFHNKLKEFDELIKELTLQDVEATAEERRQIITGNGACREAVLRVFGSYISEYAVRS